MRIFERLLWRIAPRATYRFQAKRLARDLRRELS